MLDYSARNVQICNYSGKRYYYQVRLLCVRVRVRVCVRVSVQIYSCITCVSKMCVYEY